MLFLFGSRYQEGTCGIIHSGHKFVLPPKFAGIGSMEDYCEKFSQINLCLVAENAAG